MTGKQMTKYYQIKDECREGLLRHLEKACTNIPGTGTPRILDIGCGTGVPTMWLADHFSGRITAIDNDKEAIGFLLEKIHGEKLENRVEAHCISFLEFDPGPGSFDIILAEGFLNVVGFEAGFQRIIKILKSGGYFIIHDEYKEHRVKCDFIQENQCRIIDTLYLDEGVWWDDYYRQLEAAIHGIKRNSLLDRFSSDMKEIAYYKKDPSPFRSMYYVLQKS
jgi:cyclopropane fatty-acyl-phospholipid synthase-like methyltransferase